MLDARSKENIEEVSLASVAGSSYETEIRLFGLIPVKTVAVNVIEEPYAVPGGTPFGIKMETDGVIVVGVTDVQTPDATVNPAAAAGIKRGDIITEADGHAIKDNEAFAEKSFWRVPEKQSRSCMNAMGRNLKLSLPRRNPLWIIFIKQGSGSATVLRGLERLRFATAKPGFSAVWDMDL